MFECTLRKSEPSSLACVSDVLYLRTASMGADVLCVAIACDVLAEIGPVAASSPELTSALAGLAIVEPLSTKPAASKKPSSGDTAAPVSSRAAVPPRRTRMPTRTGPPGPPEPAVPSSEPSVLAVSEILTAMEGGEVTGTPALLLDRFLAALNSGVRY